ncbi:MAG TPA: hypothetical protein VFS26_02780 [Solirubrobacterales bacterium]|nr:hypothetical protein [Solirubrobacterales bacterium]
MQNLRALTVLLLLAALAIVPSAQAELLPGTPQLSPSALLEEEEAEEEEAEEEAEESEAEAEEEEECEPEEGEPCEEAPAPGQQTNDECLLKKASAIVTANPGRGRLRLTVRYRTLKPATVLVEASLQGSKGVLYLGNDHARFRRSGVYRDTFALAEKKMKKALAARQFSVELQVVNTPPSCRVELTAHRDGARKLSWS